MEITKLAIENALKISISGDLDAGSSLHMDEVMSEAFERQQYNLLIDCASLDYISSAGMGVFISRKSDFDKKHGKFVFCNMNENVYSAFELLGLHHIFPIVESESEAREVLPPLSELA